MDGIVVFIPVRGGSKSIPLKNVKDIGGKPLVHWGIDAALDCGVIDRVVVSTDSDIIKGEVAKYLSNPRFSIYSRDPATATDTASTESAMLEYAEAHEFKTIILVQATSPLLTSKDLLRAIDESQCEEIDSVLSVVRQKRFIWECASESKQGKALNYDYYNRPRRQDFDGYFVENGAFYLTGRDRLLESKCRISGRIGLVEMCEETYYELDTPSDWTIVERFMRNRAACHDKLVDIAQKVKLFATDVDGVLTDAGMYYTEKGDELKKFNTRDGMGLSMLRDLGIKTAIVTSEETEIVARRAKKLNVDHLFQGVTDKVKCIEQLISRLGIRWEEVCYVGDDRNDTSLLKQVGLSCCPADGISENETICDYACKRKGGDACVREVVDHIVEAMNVEMGEINGDGSNDE